MSDSNKVVTVPNDDEGTLAHLRGTLDTITAAQNVLGTAVYFHRFHGHNRLLDLTEAYAAADLLERTAKAIRGDLQAIEADSVQAIEVKP